MDNDERLKPLVAAMPGRPMAEHFAALNRASAVFSGNSNELQRHVAGFLGTDAMAGNLGDKFEPELVRLLHNYLASVGSLRDTHRAIHRRIWKDRDSNDRSEWEKAVYTPEATRVFGPPPVAFIQNLRNYTLHYALPVPTTSTRISWTAGSDVVHQNELRLNKAKLRRYKKWTSAAKTYINSHDEWVEFLPAIASYSTAVREFFQWFWDTIHIELDPELSDFKFSDLEYALAQSERLRWQEWKQSFHPTPGIDPPADLHQKTTG
ncbi:MULTISPECIES: hypothetical protein [unclassified Rhodococcus (in: high G+C Gram-positive bacteria)]|uniref:hypothetical protein n=1 Tax=unclassified Rhodococcus (in: high G+C Gram-positive bacteria) TaxID=192944 RepID=UPI000B9AD137|nr:MULTISPECIES: hypothetical protein [unclassified Rhodococcus (in: high G+C Gram-positive bacteria)]OZE31518.1 hypothetical protein CH259_25660 [Rhodococcus sp. 05-2254-4]OZE42448.1 hypothetical protein CH261_20145 [Rhodococcus sp. 05-2254-3]OZE46604.1 hypothetical protein CH283_19810 [Rhodococcus sp. 05-2254-2]